MNRVHRYTLFCFLLAAAFVLGSMAGMDYILKKKESRLLRESGTAAADLPVAAWPEPKNSGGQDTEASAEEQEEKQLTIEQIEEVVSYRADATEEILHEPVTGQITMEEAIASGENWLAEMGFTGEKNESAEEEQENGESVSEKKSTQNLARRASLGVRKNRAESGLPMEPYYSFWTVRFSDKSIYAVLSVNAVTGKIWDAEITLYNNLPDGFSWERLDLFLKLAGVQQDTENFVEINDTNTGAIMRLKNSLLCAETKYYDIVVDFDYNEGNSRLSADEEYGTSVAGVDGIVEHYADRQAQCLRVILFRLIV